MVRFAFVCILVHIHILIAIAIQSLGNFILSGFPGFGIGLHGLMYTIYDPREMVSSSDMCISCIQLACVCVLTSLSIHTIIQGQGY